MSETLDPVARKIQAWIDALIDLTRRNPLLSLPKAAIRINEPGADALYKRLVVENRAIHYVPPRFTVDGSPPVYRQHEYAVSDEDRKRMGNLRQKGRLAIAEQGINVLYVTFGLLEWNDPKDGKVLRSPLLLVPVELERLPGDAGFSLKRYDDEVTTNPTLAYYFAQPKVAVPAMPDTENEDALVPSAFLSEIRHRLSHRTEWRVLPNECYLGGFSFLRLVMYRDLIDRREELRRHPVIASLAGDREAINRLPEIAIPATNQLDRTIAPKDNYHILPADPSQERAVLAARRGQSFVLQGPPGTGKTQTISNIIAGCMADGKSVLFVSEKMAALTQVYQRLSKPDPDRKSDALSLFCLEAHSHKANRNDIRDQIKKAWDQRFSLDIVRLENEASRLADDCRDVRERLNVYVRELHRPVAPLGISPYEAAGTIAALEATAPDFPFFFAEPLTISADQYRSLERLVATLATYADQFPLKDTSPWRGIKAAQFSVDLQMKLLGLLQSAVQAADALDDQASALAEDLQWPQKPVAPTPATTTFLIQVAKLLSKSPCPLQWWLSEQPTGLTILEKKAGIAERRCTEILETRRVFLERWAPAFLDLPHVAFLQRLGGENEQHLRPALGQRWGDLTPVQYEAIDASLEAAVAYLSRLVQGSRSLASLLGIPVGDTLTDARNLVETGALAGSIAEPQEGWFAGHSTVTELRALAEETRRRHEQHDRDREMLLRVYTEDVLSLDVSGLLQRFGTEYRDFFRFFKPGFWRDRKTVAGALKDPASLKARDIVEDLSLAKKVGEQEAALAGDRDRLIRAFGNHYQGNRTDWPRLDSILEKTSRLLHAYPNGALPSALVQRLVAGGSRQRELVEQQQLVATQIEETDRALSPDIGVARFVVLSGTDQMPASRLPLVSLQENCQLLRNHLQDFREARSAILAHHIGGVFETARILEDLRRSERLVTELDTFQKEEPEFRTQFEDFYSGFTTDWDRLKSALAWSHPFVTTLQQQSVVWPRILEIASDRTDSALRHEIGTRGADIETYQTTLTEALSGLGPLFHLERFTGPTGSALYTAPYIEVRDWAGERLARLSELERWLNFWNLRDVCERSGLLSFFEVVTSRHANAELIVPAFQYGFHRRWLDAVVAENPILRGFSPSLHEQDRNRFAGTDLDLVRYAPDRIRAKVQERKPATNALGYGEVAVLNKLLQRKRLPSIRKALAEIPTLLTKIMPCVMMSPLSVSLFLDAGRFSFDVVVFDEASQIFTEAALGAILRGKQVIIAGDTKQMPPSSFFSASLTQTEDDADDDDQQAASAREFESVLSTAAVIAGKDSGRFAEHYLGWHYRSRHESLIAFSRKHFYQHLTTFPSAQRRTAVESVYVSDGVYYGGKTGSRTNPIEARRVAELVARQAREHPHQSIGVITMSEAHQEAVREAVSALCRTDEELARLLDEENPRVEPFFVKNIETVQGDERDVIFFSIGYGPDSSGTVRQLFGPLNLEGGERRLNVAVTRAKDRCVVVHSLQPGQINPDRIGRRLLREYIAYAMGESDDANSGDVTAGVTRDNLIDSIARALKERGHLVMTSVGRFDFRVDIGVVDPDNQDRFLVGILCDGAVYASGETARGRDRLSEAVLRKLDWRLIRVWALDWQRNATAIIEQIEKAIGRAKAGLPENVVPVPKTRSIEDVETSGIGEVNLGTDPLKVDSARTELPGLTYFERFTGELMDGVNAIYAPLTSSGGAQRMVFVYQLINAEGPIHWNVVAPRVAAAAGLNRAGNKIQQAVEQSINMLLQIGKAERRGDFLWPIDMETAPARVPKPGDEPRPIDHISLEEIGEVILALLKEAVGMQQNEVISETARLLGYARTGSTIEERISLALSRLELDTRIHVRGGQVLTFDT